MEILITLGWIFGSMVAYIVAGLLVLLLLSLLHLRRLWQEGAIPFMAFCFALMMWPVVLIIYILFMPFYLAKVVYVRATGLIVEMKG